MANQQDDVFIHYHDPDEQETAEWLDAFHAVIENEGPERAHYLMERIADFIKQLYEYFYLKKNEIKKLQKNIFPKWQALK